MTRRQANMGDVANMAGVSTATVSRALRDLPGVGAATRERIKRIAAELAYVISPEASRLAKGSTGRVAVITHGLHLWHSANMLSGIEAVLRDADIDVLVYHVGGSQDRERFFSELPTRRKADAVVLVTVPLSTEHAHRMHLLGTEVIIAGASLEGYPQVRVDDRVVARQAVEHLIGLGHTKIAMIRSMDAEDVIWEADLERGAGYYEAMAAAELEVPSEYLLTIPFGIEPGAHAMEALLDLPERPTAIFAYADEIAVGCLRTLRRRGIRVPEDISIIGVDDHPLAVAMDLTTIHQPVYEQGRLTGELVLAALRGETVPHELLVPTHLVERSTTGPAPRSMSH